MLTILCAFIWLGLFFLPILGSVIIGILSDNEMLAHYTWEGLLFINFALFIIWCIWF